MRKLASCADASRSTSVEISLTRHEHAAESAQTHRHEGIHGSGLPYEVPPPGGVDLCRSRRCRHTSDCARSAVGRADGGPEDPSGNAARSRDVAFTQRRRGRERRLPRQAQQLVVPIVAIIRRWLSSLHAEAANQS